MRPLLARAALGMFSLALAALAPAAQAGLFGGAPSRIEGGNQSDWFGYSVSSAGDVNGDGYDDVVIGPSGYVFHGGPGGIPGANDPSSAASYLEGAGNVVAGAGDVNGDGYDDVIAGVPNAGDGQAGEGLVYVFLGSADGITGSFPATELQSNQEQALFGFSVAGAGDVNGDGYDDVVVGAMQYDAPESEGSEGTAFVFHGSASGIASGDAATLAAAQLESNQVGAFLGSSVAGAGDVNGDGYDDVVVGALGYDAGQTDEGAAFVFHGSAAGIGDGNPSTAAAQLEANQASASLGVAVSGAGDVNGDGYGDVVVGAFRYDSGQSDEGAAFVFHGSATGIDDGNPGTADTRLESDQQDAAFGGSFGIVIFCCAVGGGGVASAGDVNADGYGDVVVGAFLYDSGQFNEGAAFVFLGGPSGIPHGSASSATARLEADVAQAEFGFSVAGAGDVDGDGQDDLIVGARVYTDGESAEGAAFVYVPGPACADGSDDDGDGATDYPADAGCSSAADGSERSPSRICDNGTEEDGDHRFDYPADPGCRDPGWALENPQCQDGLHNDGDGLLDWDGGASAGVPPAQQTASDPQCTTSWKNKERSGGRCGLGAELAPVLLGLYALARRRAADPTC